MYIWYTIDSRLYAQFTAQPEDITAVEGETVKFSCILQESNSSPIWIINNILYHRINLGGNYRYEKDGLTVLNVELSMNNTSFQCITPTAESTVGILYVKQQIRKFLNIVTVKACMESSCICRMVSWVLFCLIITELAW